MGARRGPSKRRRSENTLDATAGLHLFALRCRPFPAARLPHGRHAPLPDSFLPIAGAAGLGLVWGWWSVLLGRATRRPAVVAALIVIASAGAGFVVHPFASRSGVVAFAIAAAAAGFVHLAWRQSLRSSTSHRP